MCIVALSNDYPTELLCLILRGFLLNGFSLTFFFKTFIGLLKWDRKARLLDLPTTPQ